MMHRHYSKIGHEFDNSKRINENLSFLYVSIKTFKSLNRKRGYRDGYPLFNLYD